MNTEQFDTFLKTDPVAPVAATAVPVSNTETVSEETTEVVTTKPKVRSYTRKQDMQNGNDAILATLSFDAAAPLDKQQILTKLSEENKALVFKNWNMRLNFLQETGEISSVGVRAGKKYFRAAQPA